MIELLTATGMNRLGSLTSEHGSIKSRNIVGAREDMLKRVIEINLTVHLN